MADDDQRQVTAVFGMPVENLASTRSVQSMPVETDKTVEERLEPVFAKMSDELLRRVAHSQDDVVAFEGRPTDASNEHIQALAKLQIERRGRRRDRRFHARLGVALVVLTVLLTTLVGLLLSL